MLTGDRLYQNFSSNVFIHGVWENQTDSTISCYSLRRDIIYNLSLLKINSLNRFTQCTDIITYDEPGQYNRFTIVYVLTSLLYNFRLQVFTQTNEIHHMPSVAHLFKSANWGEREIWDLFGIFFSNHPDLRRIITDYGFHGHPLRKDFPLTGYLELQFSEQINTVAYAKIELLQEYKSFSFAKPQTN